MKVLYFSTRMQYPPAGGPYLRVHTSIKALGAICDLHLVIASSKEVIGGEKAQDYYASFAQKFTFAPSTTRDNYYSSFFSKILFRLKMLFVKDKAACRQHYEAIRDAKFLIAYARKEEIKIIWFGYGNIGWDYFMMKYIKENAPDLKIVCCTDGVSSRFFLRGLSFHTDQKKIEEVTYAGALKQQQEKEWVNFCDVTTAVSDVDKQYYLNLAKKTSSIKVFANAIDLDDYNEPVGEAMEEVPRPYVLLPGYFGPKSALEHGALWFLHKVFPKILQEAPEVNLLLIGKGAHKTFGSMSAPRVTIIDEVPSMVPYFRNADALLVPLFFESGTRFKILEAGACLTPVVSTTLGAEGLDVGDGREIIMADRPNDFAKAVIRLRKDAEYAGMLKQNCLRKVTESYSLDTLKRQGRDVLSMLQ